MTPEQALAKLESDFAAAIKTVAPAAGGEFFDDPHRNTPCGGPAGTELTEVTSDLVGVLAPADWDHDRDAAIQALRGFAGAHGYQVVVDEKAGDQVNVTLVTPGENRDAFSLGFLFFTNQRVNLLGGTPCLPNPDR